jgi:nucleotide-binding universal stress UspA family protein
MLKRVLVLLGETPASLSAREFAFHLAQMLNAQLVGLAGIDLAYIEAPMAGGIGTTAYKVRLEEQLKMQAEDVRKRLHEIYQQECKSHGLSFEWLSFEGDPVGSLNLSSETCDLMITGHDTAFHGNVREQLPEALAKMLLMTPRPIVVCGDESTSAKEIMIAYDASLPAMRTLQIFTLLGLGQGQRIHVMSIDPDKELAARRVVGATGYLRSHGYEVEASCIATIVNPVEVLRIEIVDRHIGTLVMGAYGHRGFRQFLFGSTTRALAEGPPCALFLYH